MLYILITNLFLNSYFGLSTSVGLFFNASSRIAVVAGKPAELLCDTGDNGDVKYWDHYSSTANNDSKCWKRIYNGVEVRPEFKSNINWTKNIKGMWVLEIARINASNSGFYKCVRSDLNNASFKNSTGMISELIVFASDPQCNISQHVFKEDEYVELWCNLEYFGSTAPVMEWTKDGIELDAAISNGTMYNVTDNEVTSMLRVKAVSSLHKSKYSCRCFFEPSCYPAGSSKCIAPDYQYTWTSPILLIKYPPRYIAVVPVKKVFHPGEIVACSADGYPNPDYKWYNLEDRSSLPGPELIITTEMIRDREYAYECIASNSENDIGIRRNITFTAYGSFSILTAATISTGALSILLLIAILAIRLEYVKDWVSMIIGRFRRNANIEQREEEAGEREAGALALVHMVEEDRCGGYVGIRQVAAYLEMVPGDPDHNEDNLAIGGIAESAEDAMNCRRFKSDVLHDRENQNSSYIGADGTEYMEMNGFRCPPTTNPPTLQPRLNEPALYARIDHTLQPPSPVFKKFTNFSKK